MKDLEIKNTDTEELEDLLLKVEKSFQIKFRSNEFAHVQTVSELCDGIVARLDLEDSDSCSSQQAFYKLRASIKGQFNIEIKPDSRLEDIFPKKGRRSKVKQLEERLCFKLDILGMSDFVAITLLLIFEGSLVLLFFSPSIALAGIVFSVVGMVIAAKVGRTLSVKNVSDLVEKVQRENYLKSRRDLGTCNKKEAKNILMKWFIESSALI
jgi:hypothetical protein